MSKQGKIPNERLSDRNKFITLLPMDRCGGSFFYYLFKFGRMCKFSHEQQKKQDGNQVTFEQVRPSVEKCAQLKLRVEKAGKKLKEGLHLLARVDLAIAQQSRQN